MIRPLIPSHPVIGPCVLAVVLSLGAADARAGFTLNVADPSQSVFTVPSTYTPGQDISFDFRLTGAENLGVYQFMLRLSASASQAYFLTPSSVTGADYVFGANSTYFQGTTAVDPSGSSVLTLADFWLDSAPPPSGGTLIATITVHTNSSFSGPLYFEFLTDGTNDPVNLDPLILYGRSPDPLADPYATPLQGTGGTAVSFATIQSVLPNIGAGSAPVVRAEVSAVPEPSSVTLGLVGLATILCGRRFARRLVALPNG